MANEIIVGQTLDFSSLVKIINLPDGTDPGDAVNFSQLSAVVGALVFQGGYDVAINNPNLTSPAPGAVQQGYMYVATSAGNFFTEPLEIGDTVISNIDDPAALSDWTVLQTNIDSSLIPTQDEKDAMTAANSPATGNPFATINDIVIETLAQTLLAGNTTGGTNIILSGLDKIELTDSSNFLHNTGGEVLLETSKGFKATGPDTQFATGNADGIQIANLLETRSFTVDPIIGEIILKQSGSITNDLVFDATTASRVWTLPDATGIIALLSDISTESTTYIYPDVATALGNSVIVGDAVYIEDGDGSGNWTYNLCTTAGLIGTTAVFFTMLLETEQDKIHVQNTDTGTTQATWIINSGGNKVTLDSSAQAGDYNYTFFGDRDGELAVRFLAVATAITATVDYYDNVAASTTSGDITINLPTANAKAGKQIIVRKTLAGDTVTIDGSGTETINGQLTLDLTAQYEAVLLESDGVNWNVISWVNKPAVSTGLATKSGIVASGSFTGSPKTAAVVFSTAFSDNLYSISITGEDSRNWTVESKTAAGFTINANSSSALTGNTFFQAIKTGETA